MSTKETAVKLLREYDQMGVDYRSLERELDKACCIYSAELGLWGFSKNHLRIRLYNDAATTAVTTAPTKEQ